MSEDQLIGIIYSQLLEEFGFGYSEKDLWMIAENIAGEIVNQITQLNDNQKIVLEWLVAYADKDSGDYPMQTIVYMWDCIRSDRLGVKELAALRKLTRDEQFEVLAAFAQWGEQEEAR